MPPCHVDRYLSGAGARVSLADDDPAAAGEQCACDPTPSECCDYCGSAHLEWRKCKQVCADCQQINRSCADL